MADETTRSRTEGTDPTEVDDEQSEDSGTADVSLPRLHGAAVTHSRGQTVVHPTRDTYREVVAALRADGYLMCIDVTAVDYLEDPPRDLPTEISPERFEVVVGLISHAAHSRVRVRVQVPADDTTLPTLFDEYPGSEAMEREVYDMFGITFDGHPDMSRILMPDDWEGHPLRKDYGVGTVPVKFKASAEASR